jgi:oligopeptidase A
LKTTMAQINHLPLFNDIDIPFVPAQLERLLNENREKIMQLLESNVRYDWENLLQPLDDLDDLINHLWSPIAHMHAVVNSEQLRQSYQACLPLLSEYSAEVGQNDQLYKAIKSIDKSKINKTQQKIIKDDLLSFELSGVALPKEKQERFKQIQTRLSTLSNQFDNNLLDATQAWFKHITEEELLKGIPSHAVAVAKELAEEKGLDGWVLSLEFPCYYAVITYAKAREIREEIYNAYVTRASEVGPNALEFDNGPLIDEILKLRDEKARLLGFDNYAQLSIEQKMAESVEKVIEFLTDLSTRSIKQAEIEYDRLSLFGKEHGGLENLEPWDISYVSEKKRQHLFNLSQEDLRPYFPEGKVIEGMFEIVNRLFGIKLEAFDGVQTWHRDVKFYQLFDDKGQLRGQLFVDLYARKDKRGGAWMDECQVRRILKNGDTQLPVAFLTCNFAPPSGDKPATFSHEEVLTLFHEFGHCLHHLLTRVDYASASGINGVEWDAVELPSQMLENWCWEYPALSLISSHVDNGEPLPHELFEKLIAAKNFQSAMAMMRQLEFALFDYRIHLEYDQEQKKCVQTILGDVRKQACVVPIASYNRFQNGFSHIFAGGYAAGYYSYKWAEVLSSDAYSRFEEEGIFNQHTGRDFMHFILERGGARKAQELFVAFRGRKPKIDALLKHNGIK